MRRTRAPYAKTPARIDGKPVSTFAANLTALARRLCGPVSARNTALRMPKGMLMRAARATMTRVPRTAFPNPPPSSRGAGGSWVKTPSASLCPPCQASIQTTEKRGIRARSVMIATSPLMRRSIRVLGRRRDFSSSEKSTSAKGLRSPVEGAFRNPPFIVISCMAVSPSSFQAGRCALQHNRPDDVHEERDRQQDQCRVHEHCHVLLGRLREVIGQKGREGVCG